MKTIAIMSPKGGVGKTTTADSLAYILGEMGKRVLLIEGDQQGDTSKTFMAYDPEGVGMSELLERHISAGGDYYTKELIRETAFKNVSIIPGNGYLMKTDMVLLTEQDTDQVTRLRTALEEVKDDYDYCVCDCGRLFDMVVINILIAAQLVIAPVKIGGFEVDALNSLEEQVEDLKELNGNLRIKALLTMKQGNKTTKEFEEWLKAEPGLDTFETVIRRSVVVEKASMMMLPLTAFSKRGNAQRDYWELAEEIIREMEG